MTVAGLGAPVLEVVQEGLTDHHGQGKGRGVAGLAFGDRQTLALPVNVVEGQRGDFPAPQTVGDQ